MKLFNIRVLLKILLGLLISGTVIYFVIRSPDIPLNELKKRYADENSQFWMWQGKEVHYRIMGSGTDTILLLHGTGASLHTWDKWNHILADSLVLIAMDLPAYGLTGPHPARDYSIQAYVAFLENFTQYLNINSCFIAGNSLGGNIAWNYSLNHPKQIEGMILLDPSGYPSQSTLNAIKVAQTPILNQLIKTITPRSLVVKNLKSAYVDHTLIDDNLISRYHDLIRRPGNRQAFIDRANQDHKSNSMLIKESSTPALVIWGEEDLIIPTSHADSFARDLPIREIHILPSVGHLPMEEAPEISAELILNFINKLKRSE